MSIPLLQDAFARTEFARELGGRIPGRGALLRLGGLAAIAIEPDNLKAKLGRRLRVPAVCRHETNRGCIVNLQFLHGVAVDPPAGLVNPHVFNRQDHVN